jgi:hypothetical protein
MTLPTTRLTLFTREVTNHTHSESDGEVEGVEGGLVNDDEVVPGRRESGVEVSVSQRDETGR